MPTLKLSDFHNYLICGNVKKVKKILKQNPKIIHQAVKDNDLPIIVAVKHNQEEIVDLLLKEKANVNQKSNTMFVINEKQYRFSNITPLGAACVLGYSKIVKKLIAYQAELESIFTLDNLKNTSHKKFMEYTPLAIACYFGWKESIELLLAEKINLNQQLINKYYIYTVVNFVIISKNLDNNYKKKLLDEFISKGARFSDQKMLSGLAASVMTGNIELVNYFIEKYKENKISLDETFLFNNFNKNHVVTSLMIAVYSKQDEIVYALLKGGADPNCDLQLVNNQSEEKINNCFSRPVFIAINTGTIIGLSHLLEFKADVFYIAESVNNRKYLVLSVAVKLNEFDKFKLIYKHMQQSVDANNKIKQDMYKCAFLDALDMKNNSEIIEFMVKEIGLNPNTPILDLKNEQLRGFTPFSVAVGRGHIEAIRIFIKCGSDPKYVLTQGGFKGISYLQIAVINNQIKAAEILLAAGVDALFKSKFSSFNLSCEDDELNAIEYAMLRKSKDFLKLFFKHNVIRQHFASSKEDLARLIYLAFLCRFYDIFSVLEENKINIPQTIELNEIDFSHLVTELEINYLPIILLKDKINLSLVRLVVWAKQPDLVKFYIAPELRDRFELYKKNFNLLSAAILIKNIELVKVLLDCGEDLNKEIDLPKKRTITPLAIAVINREKEIINISHRYNPNWYKIINYKGNLNTPLKLLETVFANNSDHDYISRVMLHCQKNSSLSSNHLTKKFVFAGIDFFSIQQELRVVLSAGVNYYLMIAYHQLLNIEAVLNKNETSSLKDENEDAVKYYFLRLFESLKQYPSLEELGLDKKNIGSVRNIFMHRYYSFYDESLELLHNILFTKLCMILKSAIAIKKDELNNLLIEKGLNSVDGELKKWGIDINKELEEWIDNINKNGNKNYDYPLVIKKELKKIDESHKEGHLTLQNQIAIAATRMRLIVIGEAHQQLETDLYDNPFGAACLTIRELEGHEIIPDKNALKNLTPEGIIEIAQKGIEYYKDELLKEHNHYKFSRNKH